METIKKVWLVWSRSGHTPPRYEHFSFESAKMEAERLASINPGTKFFVLETVGVAVKKTAEFYPITSIEQEIPF